jgi:hypothetical protein
MYTLCLPQTAEFLLWVCPSVRFVFRQKQFLHEHFQDELSLVKSRKKRMKGGRVFVISIFGSPTEIHITWVDD